MPNLTGPVDNSSGFSASDPFRLLEVCRLGAEQPMPEQNVLL